MLPETLPMWPPIQCACVLFLAENFLVRHQSTSPLRPNIPTPDPVPSPIPIRGMSHFLDSTCTVPPYPDARSARSGYGYAELTWVVRATSRARCGEMSLRRALFSNGFVSIVGGHDFNTSDNSDQEHKKNHHGNDVYAEDHDGEVRQVGV